jgi:tetratricopeptide (TPR) repeat protein
MEQMVFPDEAVQRRLAEFVLLRVDFDKARGRFGVRGIPAFVFFDPDERIHYRIVGARPASGFVQALDGIRLRAADTLAAARLLSDPDQAAKGHLLLGRTYLRGGEVREAGAEFEAAAKEATRRADPDTAAFARADAAYVTSLMRGRTKALKSLAELANHAGEEPARVRAYRHLILGRIRQDSKDHEGAREAFAEAVRAAADDAAIRREAELALANLPIQPRRTP